MYGQKEMVRCPYNASHLILKPKMAAHLIKCRKQHCSESFSTCPFNATHDIPTPELQYHIENCKDQGKMNSFVYTVGESKPKSSSADSTSADIELPPSTENWDEETTMAGSYLDIKEVVLENRPVLRFPVGMSKAERKAFFSQETERFHHFSKDKHKDHEESD